MARRPAPPAGTKKEPRANAGLFFGSLGKCDDVGKVYARHALIRPPSLYAPPPSERPACCVRMRGKAARHLPAGSPCVARHASGAQVMQRLPRIHYTPRTGVSYESAARHVGPGSDEAALVRRYPDDACSFGLVAGHPVACERGQRCISNVAVKTLVKGCGAEFLERCLGKTRPRELMITIRRR